MATHGKPPVGPSHSPLSSLDANIDDAFDFLEGSRPSSPAPSDRDTSSLSDSVLSAHEVDTMLDPLGSKSPGVVAQRGSSLIEPQTRGPERGGSLSAPPNLVNTKAPHCTDSYFLEALNISKKTVSGDGEALVTPEAKKIEPPFTVIQGSLVGQSNEVSIPYFGAMAIIAERYQIKYGITIRLAYGPKEAADLIRSWIEKGCVPKAFAVLTASPKDAIHMAPIVCSKPDGDGKPQVLFLDSVGKSGDARASVAILKRELREDVASVVGNTTIRQADSSSCRTEALSLAKHVLNEIWRSKDFNPLENRMLVASGEADADAWRAMDARWLLTSQATPEGIRDKQNIPFSDAERTSPVHFKKSPDGGRPIPESVEEYRQRKYETIEVKTTVQSLTGEVLSEWSENVRRNLYLVRKAETNRAKVK